MNDDAVVGPVSIYPPGDDALHARQAEEIAARVLSVIDPYGEQDRQSPEFIANVLNRMQQVTELLVKGQRR